MLDDQSNPYASRSSVPLNEVVHWPVSVRRLAVSLPLIAAGLIIGVVGLALVSNRYGNTDTYGLLVVGLAGMAFFTGISSLFLKLRYSVIVGVAAAPVSVSLLFVLFWVWVIVTAMFF